MPTYTAMPCKSALHRLARAHPYWWDLNIYRGCSHGCAYCYARYAHRYLGDGDPFKEIGVKVNIAEVLERELASPKWQRDVVNLGGVCDSYQPCEADYKLMPDVLRLFIKHRTPIVISTKSDLILRDYDLICELAELTYVNIAASVISLDAAALARVEPGAVSPARRIAMLKAFKGTKVSTGLHMMPILPHLTDDPEGFCALFDAAADAGVSYLLPGTLYLRGETKPYFLSYLQTFYPNLYGVYRELYGSGGLAKAYKQTLYGKLRPALAQRGLITDYMAPMRARLRPVEATQLSLFEP